MQQEQLAYRPSRAYMDRHPWHQEAFPTKVNRSLRMNDWSLSRYRHADRQNLMHCDGVYGVMADTPKWLSERFHIAVAFMRELE
jgi:hypothetical protein